MNQKIIKNITNYGKDMNQLYLDNVDEIAKKNNLTPNNILAAYASFQISYCSIMNVEHSKVFAKFIEDCEKLCPENKMFDKLYMPILDQKNHIIKLLEILQPFCYGIQEGIKEEKQECGVKK